MAIYIDGKKRVEDTRGLVLVSEKEFIGKLLAIAGDVRMLWMPSLTGTTATDKSRHEATITYSKEISTWDTPPSKLGNGTVATFDGTDEEGDTPDNNRLSFGDGANDSPFSVLALINTATLSGNQEVIAKESSAAAAEWRMQITSGKLDFYLSDESASSSLNRGSTASLVVDTWLLGGYTYDGSSLHAGAKMWKDGVELASTGSFSSTYTAMENTVAITGIAKRYSSAERFFNGKMGFVLITGKELNADEQWAIKELVNGYYGLSL